MSMSMSNTPSELAQSVREILCDALNQRLADGLDLYSHFKVAHWNVKGPHFAALHPTFEGMGTALLADTDKIAERLVTLGGLAVGTLQDVLQASS
jgi:starvation-inducible DNA-binding protein